MTLEQIEALRKFAKDMIERCWEGCEGGDEIQDAADRQGLIVRVPCTKENEHIWREIDGMEDCEADNGDHFYQLAPWLRGKP